MIFYDLTAEETRDWAGDPTQKWPCSELSGKQISIELANNGDLVELLIGGEHYEGNLDGSELMAISDDCKKGYFD